MAVCGKCDFTFDPAGVPGGQCPRCLLLGLHEDSFEGLHADFEHEEPATSLEDDELAAELPGFELVERIGRGGMGVVWRARERVLDRYVAIKLLRNASNDTAFVERFTREARVMARLNHPNIVTLYSFGRTKSNHCYLVMEMVEGTDLAHLMSEEVLDVATALAIAAEVCRALSHAHEAGFVHRDIKPGNVLIDTRGQVKVADFGLARLNRKADTMTLSITKHGFAVGTPHYVAPEQANGKGQEDHRADIYSLGVMLYQMLTRELPRGVFKPPSMKQKMDRRLDKIVLRALQEEPEKRYPTVALLQADLQKVRAKIDPGLLADMKAARHATRWRQRFEMGLAIAVSALLGVMIAWYAREWLDSPRKTHSPVFSSAVEGGVRALPQPYIPRISGLTVTRAIQLQPPSMPSGTRFGRAVRTWGDWLAVGAANDAPAGSSGHGSVYLYQRKKGGNWALVQRISNPDEETEVQFGHSLAMNDGWLLIGAPSTASRIPGRAYLYRFKPTQNAWASESDSLVLPPSRSNSFGIVVAIQGGRAAVMDIERDPENQRAAGALTLYAPGADGKTWIPEAFRPQYGTLAPFSPVFHQDGLILSVVDVSSNQPGTGGVGLLLHSFDAAGTPQVAVAPAAVVRTRAAFSSIFASPKVLAMGAPNANDRNGRGWLLERQPDGSWGRDILLDPPAGLQKAEFGKAVAVRGDWLVVGADHQLGSSGPQTGALCLYRREAGAEGKWTHMHTVEPQEGDGLADYGNTVVMGDHFIAVGAPDAAALGNQGATMGRSLVGAVIIYEIAERLEE